MSENQRNFVDLPANTSIRKFNSVIKTSGGLVVCEFYAPWCPPCKRLGMQLSRIAEENSDVTFLRINIEENVKICSPFNVTTIPHLEFLKDGEIDGKEGYIELAKIIGTDITKVTDAIGKYK